MADISWKDQYKHPLWQKKRLEALEVAGFSCEHCDDSESQLHVHHKQYFKGRRIWEYELSELSVLCEACHEEAHQLNDKLKAALATTDATTKQIIGYLDGHEILTSGATVHVFSYEHAEGIADCLRVKTQDVIALAQANSGNVSEFLINCGRKD